MGWELVGLLRRGVWAALTGGCYLEPQQGGFANTFHLYLWLALLAAPFVLHLAASPSKVALGIYCATVALLFTVIKTINYRLHVMFEEGEIIRQSAQTAAPTKDRAGSGARDNHEPEPMPSVSPGRRNRVQDIQLTEFRRDSATPPVHHSSWQSILDPGVSDDSDLPTNPKDAEALKEKDFRRLTAAQESNVLPLEPTYRALLMFGREREVVPLSETGPGNTRQCDHSSRPRRSAIRQRQNVGNNPTHSATFTSSPHSSQDNQQMQNHSRSLHWGSSGCPSDSPRHEASSHHDTSTGATHFFVDELGEVKSYTFGPDSRGFENTLDHPPSSEHIQSSWDQQSHSPSYASGDGHDGAEGTTDEPPHQHQPVILQRMRIRRYSEARQGGAGDREAAVKIVEDQSKCRQSYRLWILPGKWMEIQYNRLALLTLLDRNQEIGENVLAVCLAILVALLGFTLLNQGHFKDISVFHFCLVIASCQYSLLKSAQPDPASPVHGHNRIVVYSRSIYFSICCGLVWVLDLGSKCTRLPTSTLYGFRLLSPENFATARDFIIGFTQCFPVIFLMGLLPQINTFLTYLLEQVDMHIFGGSAATGLLSSLYGLCRSLLAVSLLYALCIGTVKAPWDAQHIPALFSAYCGLLVASCYHLSRQSSEPAVLVSLIRSKLFNELEVHNPEHPLSENKDALPEKLRNSVREVLKSDLVMCAVITLLTFAISTTTVFLSLKVYVHVDHHSSMLALFGGKMCCSLMFYKNQLNYVEAGT